MQKYKCQICHKKHNIFYSMESPDPQMVFEIPEEERAKRIKKIDHICFVDRKYVFMNGTIYIKINDLKEFWLSWKVWAEIKMEEFQRALGEFEKGNIKARIIGNLILDLPFYENMENLQVEIEYGEDVDNTVIKSVDQNHPLTKDQEAGISIAQLTDLMTRFHHPELFKEKKNHDKPFLERLMEQLKNIEDDFIAKDKDFVLDVSSPRITLFQVISSKLLEGNPKGNQGFGIHLSFDETNEESIEEITRFKKVDYSKEFSFYELDGIPTYQIDVNKDKMKLSELIEKLVRDVYEEEVETIDLNSFES